MRVIGMDIHRTFAEAVMIDGDRLMRLGRINMSRDHLAAFAAKLTSEDHIVIEATGNAHAVAEAVAPFVGRVIIANPRQVHLIAKARIKTDVIDATVLARLYASGFLPEVWVPDQRTLSLRRQVTRRNQIVRQRVRLKTMVQAILHAHLTRGEDYAWIRPALHAKKLRDLELRSGQPARRGQLGAGYAYNLPRSRREERQRGERTEAAYKRLTEGWTKRGRRVSADASKEERQCRLSPPARLFVARSPADAQKITQAHEEGIQPHPWSTDALVWSGDDRCRTWRRRIRTHAPRPVLRHRSPP